MSTISERIVQVRKASGLSQEAFGALGGVGRQTQINYEKGTRSPDAQYLSGLHVAGYDIGYIVTGEPSALNMGVAECRHGAYTPAENLAKAIALLPMTKEDADLALLLINRLSTRTGK